MNNKKRKHYSIKRTLIAELLMLNVGPGVS
jgi:hypothetical protein